MVRSLIFGSLLLAAAPAWACPMADAAAYAQALEKVKAAPGTHIAFSVEGMHCGDCSSLVTSTLGQMPGVAAAAVDYQTGTAMIAFDPSKIRAEYLLTAIQALGYKAVLSNT